MRVAVGGPVLGIDEVGTLEGLALVVLHAGIAHKLLGQLVALGMGNDEVVVRGIHPLGKRVGHSLRQGFGVGSPGQNHLRTLHRLVLLDRDQVGKALQGVARSGLHREDGTTRVADKLLEDALLVVLLLVLELGKGANTDDVAVGAHDRNRLQQVLGLVAIHDHATLRLELPGALINVQNHDIHAEVHRCLLGREAGAEARVEEEHQKRFVATQLRELVAVALQLQGLLDGHLQVADILYAGKLFHPIKVI